MLLGKKLNNEATDEELIELAQLLKNEGIEPHSLELLREIWLKKQKVDDSALDEKWSRLSSRISNSEEQSTNIIPFSQKKAKIFWGVRVAAAAVVITITTIGYLLHQQNRKQYPSTNAKESLEIVVNVPNGERKKIILPDSTSIQLNSGSQLVYNKNFGEGNREVRLTGEAFFEVTKDAEHPFLVNTNRMTVKVLGTVFNVKAYNTKEDIETTVVEGKVEVSLNEGSEKKVILLPNEKISLKNDGLVKTGNNSIAPHVGISYEVKTVNSNIKQSGIPEEVAWIKEKVIFTDETFETVALKMERWYNVRIHFDNEKMKSALINGDFEKVDINKAMQILQMLVGFKYTIHNNDIYIE